MWHYYAGAALTLRIADDGGQRTVTLGPDLAAGEVPQAIVPPQAWQAAESTGDWTLVGCTVAPGFDFAKFELARRTGSPAAELLRSGIGGVPRMACGQQIRFKASFGEAALGVMDRLVLSDVAWERMAPLIIGRPDQKGSTGRDNRMFVEGVLWIVRTGSPWRDLPEAFGDWNSVFRRFSRWSIKGVWYRMFEAMSDDPDFEYLIIDSTIVRAHQHAAGAKKGGLKIKRSAARAAA